MSQTVKLLLIPSWIVGVAGALMAIEFVDRVIPEPFTKIIGHTVLFGVFLAPLAAFVAAGITFWHTLRGRPGVAKEWALIALAFACSIGAFVVLTRGFTS